MSNYISRAVQILVEKTTAPAEVRARTVLRCCMVCFALLSVPIFEIVRLFVFRTWPGLWLGTVPWVVSAVVGLLFGLQACSLADKRADALPLAAFCLHFISLLALLIGAALAVSAP